MNQNSTAYFKLNKLKHSFLIIALVLAVICTVWYSFNVERWNGAHDGRAEMILIALFVVSAVLFLMLLKAENRNDTLFLITAISFLCMFVFMLLLSYLFRCPYCYDWSLASL